MAKNKVNNKEVCVVTHCPFCGHFNNIYVNDEDYFDYDMGMASAQEAFPYLTRYDREQLISGICPPCWNKHFS